MSGSLLGDTFDIHGGGLDLIFPHHENEIAQSRCAHGTPIMARYWMHNGFVQAGSDKMSKSLGNFFTLHELFEEFPGEVVRYLLLSGHYRQPLDFTKEGLKRAKASLDRLYQALRLAGTSAEARIVPPAVEAALLADLNTPLALSALHDAANRLNTATTTADKARAGGELLAGGAALGLLQQDPEAWFKAGPGDGLSDAEIDRLITERNAARKAKNFAEADRIRKVLSDAKIVLEDGAQGTSWKRG
jgi:cysteinyl-tRNA synthetase